MIIDQDIQSDPRWTLSKQQGPTINDKVPTAFNYEVDAQGNLNIYMTGDAYSGAMVKLECPNLAPRGNRFKLRVALVPDEGAFEQAQVYETDIRITIGGMTYIFDLQNNIALGGVLQAGTGAEWNTTTAKLGIPPAHQVTAYDYACSIDLSAGTSTVESASVNGGAPQIVNFTQPAQELGWGPGVVVQNQRCFNAKGGSMSDASRISIEWE